VTSDWGHVFAFLAKYTWSLAPTQQAVFGTSLFGNHAIIRVCGTLDWLSSISGAKIVAQKPNF